MRLHLLRVMVFKEILVAAPVSMLKIVRSFVMQKRIAITMTLKVILNLKIGLFVKRLMNLQILFLILMNHQECVHLFHYHHLFC